MRKILFFQKKIKQLNVELNDAMVLAQSAAMYALSMNVHEYCKFILSPM